MDCFQYANDAQSVLFRFLDGEITREDGERLARTAASQLEGDRCTSLDPNTLAAIRNHINGIITTFERYRSLPVPGGRSSAVPWVLGTAAVLGITAALAFGGKK